MKRFFIAALALAATLPAAINVQAQDDDDIYFSKKANKKAAHEALYAATEADSWETDANNDWNLDDYNRRGKESTAKEELNVGTVTADGKFTCGAEEICGCALQKTYEDKLESVYACNIPDTETPVETVSFAAQSRVAPAVKCAKPKVLIPVFPGTNCEYDTARAFRRAGAEAEIFVAVPVFEIVT